MRGRKKEETWKIDRAIFNEVMKERGLSIRKIDKEKKYLTDSTIRRGLKNGFRKEVLFELAKRLDIDPEWLTGKAQNDLRQIITKEENLEKLLNWRRHPYDERLIQRRGSPFSEIVEPLLSRFGIKIDEYNKISQDERSDLEDDISILVRVAIIKNLINRKEILDPVLVQDSLIQDALSLFATPEFSKVYDDWIVYPN